MSFKHLLDIVIGGKCFTTQCDRRGALTGCYGPPRVNFSYLSKPLPVVFQFSSSYINQHNSAPFGPTDLGRYCFGRWVFAVRACWQNPSVLVNLNCLHCSLGLPQLTAMGRHTIQEVFANPECEYATLLDYLQYIIAYLNKASFC